MGVQALRLLRCKFNHFLLVLIVCDLAGSGYPILCSLCKNIFKSSSQLKRHLIEEHSGRNSQTLAAGEMLEREVEKEHEYFVKAMEHQDEDELLDLVKDCDEMDWAADDRLRAFPEQVQGQTVRNTKAKRLGKSSLLNKTLEKRRIANDPKMKKTVSSRGLRNRFMFPSALKSTPRLSDHTKVKKDIDVMKARRDRLMNRFMGKPVRVAPPRRVPNILKREGDEARLVEDHHNYWKNPRRRQEIYDKRKSIGEWYNGRFFIFQVLS